MRPPLFKVDNSEPRKMRDGGDFNPWNLEEESELTASMPPHIAKVIPLLDLAVGQLLTLAHTYQLAMVLNDKTFMSGIRGEPCYPGTHGIIVSLFTNLIIQIPALFDSEVSGLNLFKIVNAVTRREDRRLIVWQHEKHSLEAKIDAERMIDRLAYIRRNQMKRTFKKALNRLRDQRHQRHAHFDIRKDGADLSIQVKDIQVCLLNAGRIIDLSSRILVKRAYNYPKIMDKTKLNGVDVRAALFLGAAKIQSEKLFDYKQRSD